MFAISPFGLPTSARGKVEPFTNCITLMSSAGKSYLTKQEITKNKSLIDKYKVSIGQLNPDRGGVNNASDGKMNVITKINIYKPKEVMTATYLLLNYFDNLKQAENCASYLRTKFARFLLSLTLSSMHITKNNFLFVPVQNYDKVWTDEELYLKYLLEIMWE